MQKHNSYGFTTRAVHVAEQPDFNEGATGDVVVPIHLSTTFARLKIEEPTRGFEYTRCLNPTRQVLEQKLAALENARYALAFSSGLAAESSLILALVKSGDHILALDDLYGGTKRLFNEVFQHYGVSASYVDTTDVQAFVDQIRPETRMIWLESPTNPLLKLCDIQEIAQLAHQKKRDIVVVVDNTFLSPYFQKTLDLGADVVLHSTTKYISGHSDVLGGAVMLNDASLYEKLAYHQNAVGAVLSPFDSYLTIRGLKTLELRMCKHEQNALAVAEFLSRHTLIEKVIYPGLASHPQYDIAKKQATGSGGVISIVLKGDILGVQKFADALELFSLAESLGGVESLIEVPSLMTHVSIPKLEREKLGITDTLMRLSIGIENTDDLIGDLQNALDRFEY